MPQGLSDLCRVTELTSVRAGIPSEVRLNMKTMFFTIISLLHSTSSSQPLQEDRRAGPDFSSLSSSGMFLYICLVIFIIVMITNTY